MKDSLKIQKSLTYKILSNMKLFSTWHSAPISAWLLRARALETFRLIFAGHARVVCTSMVRVGSLKVKATSLWCLAASPQSDMEASRESFSSQEIGTHRLLSQSPQMMYAVPPWPCLLVVSSRCKRDNQKHDSGTVISRSCKVDARTAHCVYETRGSGSWVHFSLQNFREINSL